MRPVTFEKVLFNIQRFQAWFLKLENKLIPQAHIKAVKSFFLSWYQWKLQDCIFNKKLEVFKRKLMVFNRNLAVFNRNLFNNICQKLNSI